VVACPYRLGLRLSASRAGAVRAKIIQVDPRFSMTAAKGDEWIAINPGTDAALASGMAQVMILGKGFTRISLRRTRLGLKIGRMTRGAPIQARHRRGGAGRQYAQQRRPHPHGHPRA
jgi:hypothetical protein